MITAVLFLFSSLIAAGEIHFTVVITSFNNRLWCEGNLDSVFMQEYSNYHVLFYDDASTDGTPELIQQFCHKRGMEHKVTLVKNRSWRSQMANHYDAVHRCEDDDIIVHLDGDDEFADPRVLSFLASIYEDKNILMTFGGAEKWPARRLSPAPIPQREFNGLVKNRGWRRRGFIPAHLRSFRAWLFKQVKLQDCMINSNFADMAPCPDAGFMFPLIELAGAYCFQITKPVYRWNTINTNSQHATQKKKEKQQQLNRTICSWPVYNPLTTPEKPKKRALRVSLVTQKLLTRSSYPVLKKRLLDATHVLLAGKSLDYQEAQQYLEKARLSAHDLERTFAKLLFFSVNPVDTAIQRFALLDHDLCAWQIKDDYHQKNQTGNRDMVILNKKDFLNAYQRTKTHDHVQIVQDILDSAQDREVALGLLRS